MSHHLTSLRSVAAMLVVSGLAAVTSAAGSFEVEARETTLASTSLLLQPPAPQQTAPSGSTPASTAVAGSAAMYASKGWTGWTVTLGAANDFDSNTDLTVQGSLSTFVADRLELGVELGLWYFIQRDDTAGVSVNFDARWHFWMSEDRAWTVFAEGRIGLLGSFDDVPDGGSSFNFTPGAGLGFTRALGESPARLIGGLRWHHISNARINGDGDNPSRNALMAFVGVTWPF